MLSACSDRFRSRASCGRGRLCSECHPGPRRGRPSSPRANCFLRAVALREVVERGVMRNVVLNPRSASGEVIPTSLNASALRGPDGRAIGVIGILRDMRELDKARAYAESLIKNAPDPVFVSDLEGKILQANDAVFALLGFRPDEL